MQQRLPRRALALALLSACSAKTGSPGLVIERAPAASAAVQPAESPASSSTPMDDVASEVNVGTPSSGFVDEAGEAADPTPEPVCGGILFEPERIPVDMYFLVDSSASMAEPAALGTRKWDVMAQALIRFISDPRSASTSMGINFFPATTSAAAAPCTPIPLLNICVPTDADPNLAELGSCAASDYESPAVPVSIPSEPAALIDRIEQRGLAGATPTRAALEGSYRYLDGLAQQNPGRRVVTVLATDGDPTPCEQGSLDPIGDVAALAAAALAGPSRIQTFVIGVGQSLANLNQVAEAGGTEQAFLTDTSADLATELTDALEAIRTSATPCAYQIPDSSDRGLIDPGRVNVRLGASGAETATIPMTPDGTAAGCGSEGGWYYDDPSAPRTVELCESTCSAAFNADVELQFGCETIVKEPQ